MNPLVSVIIPVYNVELYINRCIQSIITQTYKNLEIILVDDGSTDNSSSICDHLAQMDERIKVVHQENKGAATARSLGRSLSTGTYLSFIDADDWISPDFFDHILLCEINKLDVLIMGYITEPDGLFHQTNFPTNTVLTGITMMEYNSVLHTSYDACFSCRMFFRKAFLDENKITFNTQITIGEDTIFNLYALKYAKRVMNISDCCYHYFLGNLGSITRTPWKDTLENDIRIQYEIRKQILPNSQSYQSNMAQYYTQSMVYTIIRNHCNSPTGFTYKGIKKILNESWLKESYNLIPINFGGKTFKELLVCLLIKNKLAVALFLYLKIRAYRGLK